MKFALCLLVLLPLAFAAPEKKFVMDDLMNLFSPDVLKNDLQLMLNTLGSDPTEQACEAKCKEVSSSDLLDTGCPLICNSFQALVHRYALTPDTTTTAAPAGK